MYVYTGISNPQTKLKVLAIAGPLEQGALSSVDIMLST